MKKVIKEKVPYMLVFIPAPDARHVSNSVDSAIVKCVSLSLKVYFFKPRLYLCWRNIS